MNQIVVHGSGVAVGAETGDCNEISQIYSAIREVMWRSKSAPIKKKYGDLIDLLVKSIIGDLASEGDSIFGLERPENWSIDSISSWDPHEFLDQRWIIAGLLDGILVTIPEYEEDYLLALSADYENGSVSAEKLVWHSRQSLEHIEKLAAKIASKAAESRLKLMDI